MLKYSKWLILIAIISILAGCVRTQVFKHEDVVFNKNTNDKILLMPIDIELYKKNFISGRLVHRADWTKAAVGHVKQAVIQELKSRYYQTIMYSEDSKVSDSLDKHYQLIRLHEEIIQSMHTPMHPPSKQGQFDWSLGQDANSLRKEYNADYGLFIVIRGNYTSRFSDQYGFRSGFLSLVDLITGNILWLNRTYWYDFPFSGHGEFRELEATQDSIQSLFDGFPL